LLLDTCYSGAGAVPSIDIAARFNDVAAGPSAFGVDIVTSCQSYERAVRGRLVKAIVKLLCDGPSSQRFQASWSEKNAAVSSQDLMNAVHDEWRYDYQELGRASFGWQARPHLGMKRMDRMRGSRTRIRRGLV
jgi:hypothetical protein